jgi:uncharacterized surface protein with fasciclin (FAS1) repeats
MWDTPKPVLFLRKEKYVKKGWSLLLSGVLSLVVSVGMVLAADEAKPAAPAKTEKAAAAAPAKAEVKDVVDTCSKALADLIAKAGLTETLKGAGPFTVFAPADEVLAKVDAKDAAALKAVLLNHVVAGKMMAADVAKATSLKTVGGAELTVVAKEGVVTVGGAKVVKADIVAKNGVIHSVDKVVVAVEKKAEPMKMEKKDK